MYELPLPVKRDGDGRLVKSYDEFEWYLKLQEEIYEAFIVDDKQRRAEELTDIITVCTSYLAALGFDKNARCVLQAKLNGKNDERGYFKE